MYQMTETTLELTEERLALQEAYEDTFDDDTPPWYDEQGEDTWAERESVLL